MKLTTLIGAAALLLQAMSFSAIALEVQFSKDDASVIFPEETRGDAGWLHSKGEVSFAAEAGGIVSLIFPVEGLKKYRLEVVARIEGEEVIEKNPRLVLMALQKFSGQNVCRYRVVFLDENGKTVRLPGCNGTEGFMARREAAPYTSVFYTPEDSVGLRVEFDPQGQEAHLKSFKLVEETEEDALNPNPDFRYGEFSYSGWKPLREGQLLTQLDSGKVVFKTGRGGRSPVFPVSAGEHYQVRITGRNGVVSIHYLNKLGKPISSRAAMTLKAEGVSTEFVPPPETETMFFSFHGLPTPIIEEMWVRPVSKDQ